MVWVIIYSYSKCAVTPRYSRISFQMLPDLFESQGPMIEACFLHIKSHRFIRIHENLGTKICSYNIRNAIIYNRFTWILDDIDHFFLKHSHPLLCLEKCRPQISQCQECAELWPKIASCAPAICWVIGGRPRFPCGAANGCGSRSKKGGLEVSASRDGSGWKREAVGWPVSWKIWGENSSCVNPGNISKGFTPQTIWATWLCQLYWSPPGWKQINPKDPHKSRILLPGPRYLLPSPAVGILSILVETKRKYSREYDEHISDRGKSTIMTRQCQTNFFISKKVVTAFSSSWIPFLWSNRIVGISNLPNGKILENQAFLQLRRAYPKLPRPFRVPWGISAWILVTHWAGIWSNDKYVKPEVPWHCGGRVRFASG